MTNFKLDFNDTFEGGKIKDGQYEVIIGRCNEDATQNGAEYIEFDLIVRNDLNQEHKNQHVFHKIWKAKETGKFNFKAFNTIGKACRLPNGKAYGSMKELLDDYVGKVALVTVKNETSEYNGNTYENTNVKFWNETKFPSVQHQFKQKESNNTRVDSDPFASGSGKIEVQDDDLPF